MRNRRIMVCVGATVLIANLISVIPADANSRAQKPNSKFDETAFLEGAANHMTSDRRGRNDELKKAGFKTVPDKVYTAQGLRATHSTLGDGSSQWYAYSPDEASPNADGTLSTKEATGPGPTPLTTTHGPGRALPTAAISSNGWSVWNVYNFYGHHCNGNYSAFPATVCGDQSFIPTMFYTASAGRVYFAIDGYSSITGSTNGGAPIIVNGNAKIRPTAGSGMANANTRYTTSPGASSSQNCVTDTGSVSIAISFVSLGISHPVTHCEWWNPIGSSTNFATTYFGLGWQGPAVGSREFAFEEITSQPIFTSVSLDISYGVNV